MPLLLGCICTFENKYDFLLTDIHGISLDASTTNNAACFGTLTYRNETGDVTGLPMNGEC